MCRRAAADSRFLALAVRFQTTPMTAGWTRVCGETRHRAALHFASPALAQAARLKTRRVVNVRSSVD